MKPIALTGIKPTGRPHIGNYLGMYRPALDLMDDYLGMYFVILTKRYSFANPISLKSPNSPGFCPASLPRDCSTERMPTRPLWTRTSKWRTIQTKASTPAYSTTAC